MAEAKGFPYLRVPRWIYFYATAALIDAGLICMQIAAPILGLQRLGANEMHLGAMGTLGALTYAVVAWHVGRLSDRFPRRGLSIGGLTGIVVTGLLLAFCGRLWHLIALAVLQAVATGFFWPPQFGLFADTIAPSGLARSLSRFNIWWSVGTIFGYELSGRLYDHVGWRWPFFLGTLLCLMALAIIVTSRPIAVGGEEGPAVASHPSVGPYLRQAWALMGAAFFIIGLLMNLFPKLAQSPRFAMNAEAIGHLHVVRQVVVVITFVVMAFTSFWHFRRRLAHICFALGGAGLLCVGLGGSYWQLAVGFGCIGMTMGTAYGMSIYYSLLNPASRGSKAGAHESILSGGATIGPIYGAMMMRLFDRPDAAFWMGLLPFGLIWLAGWWWARREWAAQELQAS